MKYFVKVGEPKLNTWVILETWLEYGTMWMWIQRNTVVSGFRQRKVGNNKKYLKLQTHQHKLEKYETETTQKRRKLRVIFNK